MRTASRLQQAEDLCLVPTDNDAANLRCRDRMVAWFLSRCHSLQRDFCSEIGHKTMDKT